MVEHEALGIAREACDAAADTYARLFPHFTAAAADTRAARRRNAIWPTDVPVRRPHRPPIPFFRCGCRDRGFRLPP
jgi:hypothetical protein